jgi:hypothetical protein
MCLTDIVEVHGVVGGKFIKDIFGVVVGFIGECQGRKVDI